MSATTIRLSEEFKARVAAAAKRNGTTPHNFILEAIAGKAERVERRADFDEVAAQRYADIVVLAGHCLGRHARLTGTAHGRDAGDSPGGPHARRIAWRVSGSLSPTRVRLP